MGDGEGQAQALGKNALRWGMMGCFLLPLSTIIRRELPW